ncbi:hypothetical protein [Streptomyces sp. 8N616]|uniref:hypothetical protein n=1 Tax=Streptomyces sp. 8N616 TaxID=3457414 RepID=UPI003FD06BD7
MSTSPPSAATTEENEFSKEKREAVVPSHTPSGRPIPVGPTASDFLEMLPILSTDEAVSPVHLQATRYFARPDVAYVPIHDAPPARWALVWRTSAETDAILALAKIVEQLGPLEQ